MLLNQPCVPGNLLKTVILSLAPNLLNQRLWEGGSVICVLTALQGMQMQLRFEITALELQRKSLILILQRVIHHLKTLCSLFLTSSSPLPSAIPHVLGNSFVLLILPSRHALIVCDPFTKGGSQPCILDS